MKRKFSLVSQSDAYEDCYTQYNATMKSKKSCVDYKLKMSEDNLDISPDFLNTTVVRAYDSGDDITIEFIDGFKSITLDYSQLEHLLVLSHLIAERGDDGVRANIDSVRVS